MTKSEKETIKPKKEENATEDNFLTRKKFTAMVLESVQRDNHSYIDATHIYVKRITLR